MVIRNTYLISDTHFDHAKIIEYCNRPFADVDEMNEALLRNWNDTVDPEDNVFFLGDLYCGKDYARTKYWLDQLNGDVTFIKGNHDRFKGIPYRGKYVVRHRKMRFHLRHDPRRAPRSWNDWVIYGHVHNNHPDRHPFIDGEKKRINVSAELIDYTPLSLDDLIDMDLDSIKRVEFLGGPVERK